MKMLSIVFFVSAFAVQVFAEEAVSTKLASSPEIAAMQTQQAQLKALSSTGLSFSNAGVPYRVIPNASLSSNAKQGIQSGDFVINTQSAPAKDASVVVFNEARNVVGLVNGYIWVIPSSVTAAQAVLLRLNVSYQYVESINRFVVQTQPTQAIALMQQLSGYPELGMIMLEIQESVNKTQ